MQIVCKYFVVLVVGFALILFQGCKKEDEPQESIDTTEAAQTQQVSEDENQIEADDTSISDLVSTWDAGMKDEATEKFLSIDWQDADVFNQVRGLSMSEEDIKSLSQNEIESIVGETMPLLSSMRKLFFHIATEAERLVATGDASKAKEHLNAVKEYGSSLADSNHLQIVQKHGQAAVSFAEGKLSEL